MKRHGYLLTKQDSFDNEAQKLAKQKHYKCMNGIQVREP